MKHHVVKHLKNFQDYIRELGMLLVHLGDRGDPSTQASMEHLTLESTQLLGCLKVFNPSVYKAVCQERLDGTNTVPARQLDVSWFMSLQVSRQISCRSGFSLCTIPADWCLIPVPADDWLYVHSNVGQTHQPWCCLFCVAQPAPL